MKVIANKEYAIASCFVLCTIKSVLGFGRRIKGQWGYRLSPISNITTIVLGCMIDHCTPRSLTHARNTQSS